MNRNEFANFQKELYSRDWKALCGTEPVFLQFQIFNKWKLNKLNGGQSDDSVTFEDYMLFQRELRVVEWRKVFGDDPTLDEFVAYSRYQGTSVYFHYIDTFKRKPSFEDYIRYEQAKQRFNWREINCPVPSFDDYVQFLIERDSVNIDWINEIGRLPRLEEYVLYTDAVRELDEDTRSMKQFSFKSILQQGINTGPSLRESDSRRSPSPNYTHRRSRSPDRDRIDHNRFARRSPSDSLRRRARSPSPLLRYGKRFKSRSPDPNRSDDMRHYGTNDQPQKRQTGSGARFLLPDNVSSASHTISVPSQDRLRVILSRFQASPNDHNQYRTPSYDNGGSSRPKPLLANPMRPIQSLLPKPDRGERMALLPQSSVPTPLLADPTGPVPLLPDPGFSGYRISGDMDLAERGRGTEPADTLFPLYSKDPMSLLPDRQGPLLSDPISTTHLLPNPDVGRTRILSNRETAEPKPMLKRGGEPLLPVGANLSERPFSDSFRQSQQLSPRVAFHSKDRVLRPKRDTKPLMDDVFMSRLKPPKQVQPCVFPECKYKYSNSERQFVNHLNVAHFPTFALDDDERLSGTKAKKLKRILFLIASKSNLDLEGDSTVLEQLVIHFHKKKLHKCLKNNCSIRDNDLKLVIEFHEIIHDPLPVSKIDVHQPNCISALVWWKNIVALLRTLTVEERKYIRGVTLYGKKPDPPLLTKKREDNMKLDVKRILEENKTVPVGKRETKQKETKQTETKKKPKIFGSDGYFRLDLLMKDKKVCAINEVLGETSDSKGFDVLIAGFEDPNNFPSEILCDKIKEDSRVYTCIGLDPKLCSTLRDDALEAVAKVLDTVPKVVAVGSVGLDYSSEGCDKEVQQATFRKMCELAKARKLPIVIDCKERIESSKLLEANRDCITVLQEVCSAEYPIYKKSVASFEEMHLWRETYPNTMYGVNASILTEDVIPSFLTVLAIVDLSNIVIHTDSPLKHPDGGHALNSPCTVFDVAEEIGNMKGLAVSDVFAKTTSVLAKFFNLSK